MKYSKLIFFAAILLTFQGFVLGQSVKAEVKSIDAYCKTIDSLAEKAKRPDLIFADTANYEDQSTKPKWQRFTSEKALEKFRTRNETYSIAYNWLKGNKLVASNFTNFSASGDWTMYISHTYRSDGTLARVISELRTFVGNYIITQTRYFNVNGKLIMRTVMYQDLISHEPKKASSENDAYFTDDDIYKTAAKLPFAKLIKKK